jgi:hypothetical protein
MFMGPIGEVSNPTPWAVSKAPTSDTYYLDLPLEEWPPDEFISNPDHEFDWRNLKAWHYVPIIKQVTILGNRRVKPGETVQLECIVEDISGTQTGCGVGFYGPHGRRSTMNVRMAPTTPGGYIMRGTLKVPDNAEPGTYRATEINAGNDTRHSKVYWADVHPAGKDLDIEVLPVPGGGALDVIPPQVHWVRMNGLDRPETEIRTQPISQPVPIFAYISDNKSGPAGARIRLMGPVAACEAPTAGIPPSGPTGVTNTNPCRFIDAELQKIVGKENVFGVLLSIPEWWQGGEYRVYTLVARDKSNKDVMLVHTTSPTMKNAKINLTNDPAKVDNVPPQLFSIWVDKENARLGEPVTVNAVVSDDRSGVGGVSVAFAPHPSYIDRARVVLKPVTADPNAQAQRAGLDVSSNIWTGVLQTTEHFEPGEWVVDRVVARDKADNVMDVLPEYVPDLKVKINYTGGKNLREAIVKARQGQVVNISAPGGGGSGGAGAAMATAGGPRPAATATNGTYNAITNQITLPNGRVIDLLPGTVPDPVTGKIRRVDMIPPHPARGACLNCHEPNF